MKITNTFLVLVLITGTLLTYVNTLDNDFVSWDDDKYVFKNPSIRALTLRNIKQVFSRHYFYLYVPMTMLSYMLDYQLWQLDPFGYHATNIVLHISNVVLAFLLLNLLFQNKIASFLCAFIFALHPVQVESVAWISERKNLLSSLFFLLSFISYVKYKDKSRIFFHLSCIILFLLALLSKPSVVGFPLLLVSYDYFHSSRITKKDVRMKIPFFLLTLAFCLSTVYFHIAETGTESYHGGNFLANLLTMISVFLNYLKLVCYPLNLSAIYTPTICTSIFHPKVLVSIVSLVLILTYLCFTIKRRHSSGFWILWFFVLMAPVINLIPIATIYNDRYLYLPILSFPALFYLTLGPLIGKRKLLRNIAVLVFAGAVLSCGFLSHQRNRIWRNSLVFWSDVARKSPSSAKAHNNLANVYFYMGSLDKAIEEYHKMAAIDKNSAIAHSNLGLAYSRKGLLDKARVEWEIALKLDPARTNVRENLEWVNKIMQEEERSQ